MTESAQTREPHATPLRAGKNSPLKAVADLLRAVADLLRAVLGNDLRGYTMIVALIALLIVFQISTGGKMLTASNFQNLIIGNAYVLILAMGMLMVIVIGQIDLSVGSVAGFVGMIVARSATDLGVHWVLAVALGVLVGVLIGCWQGFWLAKMGIPGFIPTLAGMMIFRGAVIWLSHSISVKAPIQLQFYSSGYLPEWGPNTGLNNSTLLLGVVGIVVVVLAQVRSRQRQIAVTGSGTPTWALATRLALIVAVIGYLTYLFGSGRRGTGFPIVGLIVGALIIIYYIVTERTPFGRHIYAVGGNKAAAALSGVDVPRTYFFTMVNMSFLAALAGILFTGRATAAGPDLGSSWELDAIAAVFIGGAAVSGGIGTVIGTAIGAFVMAVLNNGLMALGVSSDLTSVIKGLVLLAAVAFDVYNKVQGRASIIGRLTGGLQSNKATAEADETPPRHDNQLEDPAPQETPDRKE